MSCRETWGLAEQLGWRTLDETLALAVGPM